MSTYSEIRKRELEHIEQSLKDDNKMKREMAKLYRNSAEDIQRHIDADIMRFAAKENVSMAEAKKIISKTDVEAFQNTAKKYVEEKNFGPKANSELRKYNVTMRTNRLELLQARINLETIALALEEDTLTASHINEEVIKEYTRQAGILGMTVPSQTQLNTLARSVLLSDVSGATFSDRIWANQNELRANINQSIERALIRGEHPRNTAASIKRLVRDDYGKAKRAADRILITETNRAQTLMQRESFKDAEVDKYIYVAENSACDICSALDDKVFKVKNMETGVNASPMHPYCKCSVAGFVDDEMESEVMEVIEEEVIAEVDAFDDDKTYKQINADDEYEELFNSMKHLDEDDEYWIRVGEGDTMDGYEEWGYIGGYNGIKINKHYYGALEDYESLTKSDEKTIKFLDKVIDQNKINEDIVVTRYISGQALEDIIKQNTILESLDLNQASENIFKGGEIAFTNKAYTSTSLLPGNEYLMSMIDMKIEVPKGSKGYITDNFEETEMILPRNTKLGIRKMTVKDDGSIDIIARLMEGE